MAPLCLRHGCRLDKFSSGALTVGRVTGNVPSGMLQAVWAGSITMAEEIRQFPETVADARGVFAPV